MTLLDTQMDGGGKLGARLRAAVLSKIKDGEWAPGTKLPGLRTLAAETGISIGVVRKVISELAATGRLSGRQGKGIFVAPPLNRHNNVAVVLPDICHEHITYIVRGIKGELDKYSTGLLLESARSDFQEEARFAERLLGGGYAGAIIYPPPFKSFARVLTELRRAGAPFVLVNTSIDDESFPAVSVDYFRMGRTAAEYLLDRGHRNIGFLGCKSDVSTFGRLYEGIERELAERGLSLKKMPGIMRQMRLNPSILTNPRDTALELLKMSSGITAILTDNEHTAAEAYLSLKKGGVKIPKDVSLLTLGDLSAFNLTDPPITAVTQPYEEIGRLSVQALFNMFSIKRNSPPSMSISPVLVERGSVRDISPDQEAARRGNTRGHAAD